MRWTAVEQSTRMYIYPRAYARLYTTIYEYHNNKDNTECMLNLIQIYNLVGGITRSGRNMQPMATFVICYCQKQSIIMHFV